MLEKIKGGNHYQEWTMQRHRQHWTQDKEQRHTKQKQNTVNYTDEQHESYQKTGGEPSCSQSFIIFCFVKDV